jgi:spore coat polysaccharide biosynthesis protein SpsF
MTTALVVQARTGSTRLPGKVLMPLAGAPLLLRLVERLRAVPRPVEIVVATTALPGDEPIRELCARAAVRCVSGHPTDLLDRHVAAARAVAADVVVKIPSDCPLIDPAVVERVLAYWDAHAGAYDFVSNLHPPSWPDGNDVEVMPFELLELAAREARKAHEREHTTPFFWDQPERFRIGNVVWERGRDLAMSHRWTVDYPEDYAFVRAVYERLWTGGRPFSVDDVLALTAACPEIAALNAKYAGVNWYRHHLDELRTVRASETKEPS